MSDPYSAWLDLVEAGDPFADEWPLPLRSQSHSSPFSAICGTYFSAHFDQLLGQWSNPASTGAFFAVEQDLHRLMSVRTPFRPDRDRSEGGGL